MTIRVCGGPVFLPGAVDKDLRRTWKVRFFVEDDGDPPATFGPSIARTAADLPHVGDIYLITDLTGAAVTDFDEFAYCTGEVAVTPTTNPAVSYELDYTFTSPQGITGGCANAEQSHPLLAPDDIQYRWEKYSFEAVTDRFGVALRSSSHEPLTGPQVEKDDSRLIVEVTQTRLDTELLALSLANNRVNDREMYGLPPRWIKCTVESLVAKSYGSCFRCHVRRLRLEARAGGWDRWLHDVGTKFVRGSWVKNPGNGKWEWVVDEGADPSNPADYVRAIDTVGNAIKAILDGAGRPWVYEAVDDVTDCNFCNSGGGPTLPPSRSGAPQQWRLLNIYDARGRGIVLDYEAGCLWTVIDGDGNAWTLEEAGGTGTGGGWTLTADTGTETASWQLSGSAFGCNGVNNMTSLGGTAGAPAAWERDASIAPNSSERVTGCSPCDAPVSVRTLPQRPAGAPSIFRVQELTDADGQAVKLTHTSGCSWSLFDGLTNYVLSYVTEGDDRTWQLTVNGTEVKWLTSEQNWRCRGPNSLEVVGPAPAATPPWPQVVTIVAGNQPGVRRAEFYDEADLVALLGLPATLP